ncbi:hypothetical protein [Shewanella sp.]|uniref:hypothetical protein n=1 Tax=Shewanella sp. TaxID=50422 RepID=UPI003567D8E2
MGFRLPVINQPKENIINELLKRVAKAALLTIVPILIQAFTERYLSEEEAWEEPLDDEDQENRN